MKERPAAINDRAVRVVIEHIEVALMLSGVELARVSSLIRSDARYALGCQDGPSPLEP